MSKEDPVPLDPARSSLRRASFEYFTEVAKFDQRLADLEAGKPLTPSASKLLAYAAFVISIISIAIGIYNVWVNSKTEGNLVMQYIEQLAPLRPAPDVAPGSQAVTLYRTFQASAVLEGGWRQGRYGGRALCSLCVERSR